MKSYWLRCASSAMTTMLRRSESTGCRSPFSSGKNFWIVVKTTPPGGDRSSFRAGRRGSSACTGGWRSRSLAAREGAEELVVEVVAVGEHDEGRVLHRRVADDAAGVEGHRQALARALRVPDDADAPVAGLAARLLAGLVAARRLAPPDRPRPARAARSVSSTATLHRVELVVAGHLLDELRRRRRPRRR